MKLIDEIKLYFNLGTKLSFWLYYRGGGRTMEVLKALKAKKQT